MNKKHIISYFVMAISVIVMQSCTVWYPSVFYDDGIPDDSNHDVSGDVPIRPTLNMQSLNFYVNSTRGIGAFDGISYPSLFEAKYLASKFYVLSYRRGVEQQGPFAKYANLTTLMRSASNVNRTECLVSTDRTSPASLYHRGKPSMTSDLRGVLYFLDEDKEQPSPVNIYWNNSLQDLGYDFTAYYIDDAEVNRIDAREDKTVYGITIDGSQDVMVGAAPEVTMKLLEKEFSSVPNKQQVVAVSGGGYTTYGATMGVQPKIDMMHQLTRLMFRAVPAASSASNIRITKVRVLEHTKGDLTVAARDLNELSFVPTGEKSWIELRDTVGYDKDTKTLVKSESLAPVDVSWDAESKSQKAKQIGESLMLFPATSYSVEICGVQTLKKNWLPDDTETIEQEFRLPLTIRYNGGEMFEPGYTYFVSFNVFGYNHIDITVGNQIWKDGGNVDVDFGEE